MKKLNDVVTYVRNGVFLPAIVLNSRMVTENDVTTERLTVMYANPDTAQGLVNGGKATSCASFEFNVKPLLAGMVFGWMEEDDNPTEEQLDSISRHQEANVAAASVPAVDDPTKTVVEAHKGVTSQLTKDHQVIPPQAATPTPAPTPAEPSSSPAAVSEVETAAAIPVIETKEYSDGSSATGVAPLPDQSPAQQDAADITGEPAPSVE